MGICVYYLNQKKYIIIYLITLLEQLGYYSSINYIKVVGNILDSFNISKKWLSYFVTDNALNNNTILNTLAIKYGFIKEYR